MGGEGVPRGSWQHCALRKPHPLRGAGALWFDRVADVWI